MTIASKTRIQIQIFFSTYHHPRYLGTDPLVWVRGFEGRANREIAGLVASCLAYGRVAQIIATLERIRAVTGPDLLDFILSTNLKSKSTRLGDIRHRFNSGADIALLMHSAAVVCSRYGSLGAVFLDTWRQSREEIRIALECFIRTLGEEAGTFRSRAPGFDYLLPSPASGSACKRLNMYVRWMVRPDDGIDIGAWNGISPSSLIIPVDTHIASVATALGLTRRKTPDWRMAEQITANLKKIDPFDPVKYDFSLCRAGMFGCLRSSDNGKKGN